MKMIYVKPAIEVVDVKIEKGFAASADGFSIQNFEEAEAGNANSAW